MVKSASKLSSTGNVSSANDQGMLVDAKSAAKLLKDKGVLDSARKHMIFYQVAPIPVKSKASRLLFVRAK